MRIASRLHGAIAFALLIGCAIGCKYGANTSSSSSSNAANKPDASRSSNDRSTNTAAAPDIAGQYSVAGTNVNGSPYKGDLEVIKHGDVYQFRWSGGASYDGVGVQLGDVVAQAFTTGENGKGCGQVKYRIEDER